MTARIPAIIMLEDGTVFEGFASREFEACGIACIVEGALGHQELLTDPASAGLILCFEHPQAGPTGVNAEDMQSRRIFAAGLVCGGLEDDPVSFRSTAPLRRLLGSTPVLEGVDTAALAAHLRTTGPQLAAVSTKVEDHVSLMQRLTAFEPRGTAASMNAISSAGYTVPAFKRRRLAKVTVYDLGVKTGVIAQLCERGAEVTVVPWDTPASAVLAKRPDGVVLAGGPGMPAEQAVETARALAGKVATLGIGLGFAAIAEALGEKVEASDKPVLNAVCSISELDSGRTGFASCTSSLAASIDGEPFTMTHVDRADGSCMGFSVPGKKVLAVRFNPEGAPGPHDFADVYDSFFGLMGINDASRRQVLLDALPSGELGDDWTEFTIRVDYDDAGRPVVPPAIDAELQGLTDVEFQRMRDAALEVAQIEKDLVAVRFATNVKDGRLVLTRLDRGT